MNWYLTALKKYFVIQGRARRKEYWIFLLISFIVSFVLGFIDGITGMFNPVLGLGPLSGLYGLLIVIPSITVGIRRLHDTGRSGWWILLALLPIIGGLVLLVFFCLDSKPGSNQYGANPKETVDTQSERKNTLVV